MCWGARLRLMCVILYCICGSSIMDRRCYSTLIWARSLTMISFGESPIAMALPCTVRPGVHTGRWAEWSVTIISYGTLWSLSWSWMIPCRCRMLVMWRAWRPIFSLWRTGVFCRNTWCMVWRHACRILSQHIYWLKITDMDEPLFPCTNTLHTTNPPFWTTKTGVLNLPQNGGSTPTPCLDKAVHAQGGGVIILLFAYHHFHLQHSLIWVCR